MIPDRAAILDRQRSRESAARTYARWLDVVPVRAAGAEIVGADGRTYLDCLSGAGSLPLGHNHPEVVAALRATLDRGAPLHALDVATPEKDAFVTALLASLPAAMRAHDLRVQFCSPAGTDAVEAALKLARIATGRRGVVAFSGAYHGMTAGALGAGGDVAARAAGNAATADVFRLPFPYPYRCPFGLGADGARVAVHHAQRALADPLGGATPPAALVVEPVQGEGGVLPAPDAWLMAMSTLAREQGALCVVDEVQTGVGRTGTTWGHEPSGIVPDVLVASKAIGGGLPLAAIVYRAELDAWDPGAHAGTFRGNVLAMVAGARTLEIVHRDGLAERARTLGATMLDRLRRDVAALPIVGDVRGRGLMLGVEIVDPSGAPDHLGTLPAAPALARRIRSACLERGLIVELGGRHGAVLRLLPPLVLEDAAAERVGQIVAEAINAVAADPRPAADSEGRDAA